MVVDDSSNMVRRGSLPDFVSGDLRSRIARREWRPGDKIPSESVLAIEYGVSRATVRIAIKALMSTGLLRVHQGRGTFISHSADAVGIGLQELRSTSETIRAHGLEPSVECRLAEIRAPSLECVEHTGVDAGSDVLYLERSIRADDRLFGFAFDEILVPDGFSVNASDYSSSLFVEFERVLGSRPLRAETAINAVLEPELGWGADRPDPPLYLRFAQNHVDDDGNPLLFSRNFFVEDVVSFSVWRS